MKRDSYTTVLVVILLALGLGVLVLGCMGDNTATQTTASQQASLPSTTTETVAALDAEALSTFENKDPFIQQATTTSAPVSTTQSPTAVAPPITRGPQQPVRRDHHHHSARDHHHPSLNYDYLQHRHTLKILSVGDVGGAAAVTFKVDNSVYTDKRKGDVVSTSWGQIKVLDLNTSSKVAIFLQGSETLVLTVGQVVFE